MIKRFHLIPSLAALFLSLSVPLASWAGPVIGNFNVDRDLYIAQFDSKTDVDDVHSVAGVATMLNDPRFADVNYHAVAGAYGIQDGLYVPSPELFELSFGSNWSDAHRHRDQAVEEVARRVSETLANGGQVWAADAGQSDFTADWLKRVRDMNPGVLSNERVHVVQHSEWNESVTSPDKLEYVRQHANYHKIEDGNFVGNGTPGFNTKSSQVWKTALDSPRNGEIWSLAKSIADKYNGAEGRYKNDAIAAGGIDFSDVSESCWIFGFADLEDAEAFFREFPGLE